MLEFLARNWWIVVLRGVAAVLFGIVALVWPGIAVAAAVMLFGAYVFLDGAFAIWSAIAGRRLSSSWWIVLLEGLLGVVLGVLVLSRPAFAAFVLIILFGIWAVATGILEVVGAIRLRKMIENEWLLALSGILSMILGGVLLARPGAGVLALIWVIGICAILFGAVTFVLGLKVRRLARELSA